jgi:O-antigen ligase
MRSAPASPVAGTVLLVALAPAAALLLFAFVVGNLDGAAGAVETVAVHAALLLAAVLAATAVASPASAAPTLDPLRLGFRGRWLPAALVFLAAASCWASPVERAGWPLVALLPAWLLLPAGVARLWNGAAARRWGPRGVAVAVVAASAWSLVGRFALGDARAAAPLGHHNLLAVWLLALLPLALLPLREEGVPRLLAAAAGALGLAALTATGSLSAVAGVLAMALCTAVAALLFGRRRQRRVSARVAVAGIAAAVVLLLLVAVPRVGSLLAGHDPSLAARRTYWAAALRGAAERPALGWGPGSVAWTVGEHLRPVPGVNPPGEVVGDLHSLPLELLYEVGGSGLLLGFAVLALFVWRRLAAAPGAADRALAAAGLLGLAGVVAACLTVAPLGVPAVALAVAVAAGAALAGEGGGDGTAARRRGPALAVLLYAALAALLLLRPDAAHLRYDRSRGAGAAVAVELAAAVRLDPGFPLYRAHLARLSAGATGGEDGGARVRADGAAAEALVAAEAAPGVAALWLSAGDLALAAGEPWAPLVLERACRLDPLSAAAPFLLAVADPDGPGAAEAAARALLAEPRLAAATFFEGREELLTEAVALAAAWPGVAPGWGQALSRAVHSWDPAVAGDVAELRFASDRSPRTALSLYAFGRRPRPLDLAAVPLRRELARQVDLPAATTLAATAPDALGERGCRSRP